MEYKRHPLSAKYPDIKGQAWEDFKQNLIDHGPGRRSITLHEGKVLDGWQMYRASQETGVEVPTEELTEGIDPLVFVETANDHRRHESQEAQEKRRQERIARVAEKRREGKSERAIADEEGVSKSQVRRDLEEAGSTGPGGPVEPPSGKVTGKDGKERPARQPRAAKPKPETNGHAEAEDPSSPPVAPDETDALGLPVSGAMSEVFAVRQLFGQALSLRRQLADVLNKIALARGGEYLAKDLSRRETAGKINYKSVLLEDLKILLNGCEPHSSICPWCHHKHPDKFDKKCPACHGQGWVILRTWKQAPASDREVIERLVTA